MRLNTLKPAIGSRLSPKRLGRGIGSGLGKTCGRGHKGQRARAGGFHKLGFEGGQSPLQRRLPKFGFTSVKQRFSQELYLNTLNKIEAEFIDLKVLKEANLINASIKRVKVIATGELSKAVRLKGLQVTKAARALIETVGGSVEA